MLYVQQGDENRAWFSEFRSKAASTLIPLSTVDGQFKELPHLMFSLPFCHPSFQIIVYAFYIIMPLHQLVE